MIKGRSLIRFRKINKICIIVAFTLIMLPLLVSNFNYMIFGITQKEVGNTLGSHINLQSSTENSDFIYIWNRTAGGTLDDYFTDSWSDGNYIYTIGYSDSNRTDYKNNIYLVKWDLNGNVIWSKLWGAPGDTGISITGDSNNLYSIGSTWLYGSYSRIMIIKWDFNGNIVWNKTYTSGLNGDEPTKIITDSSNIYITGSSFSSSQGHDLILLKYDKNGNFIWNKSWGGTQDEKGMDVIISNSYLYVTGYTESFGAGNCDFVYLKWDLNGNLIWNKTWGGSGYDAAKSIINEGNFLYIQGESSSFGTNDNLVLLKLDFNGNVLSQGQSTKTGNYNSRDMKVYDNSLIIIIGQYLDSSGVGHLSIDAFSLEPQYKWQSIYASHTNTQDLGNSIEIIKDNLYTPGYTNGGDKGGYDGLIVKWELDLKPVAVFGVSTEQPYVNSSVSFFFTGFPGNEPAKYYYQFGDGINSTTPLQSNCTHIYRKTGTYTITLKVVDFNGDVATYSKTIEVIAEDSHNGWSYNLVTYFIVFAIVGSVVIGYFLHRLIIQKRT